MNVNTFYVFLYILCFSFLNKRKMRIIGASQNNFAVFHAFLSLGDLATHFQILTLFCRAQEQPSSSAWSGLRIMVQLMLFHIQTFQKFSYKVFHFLFVKGFEFISQQERMIYQKHRAIQTYTSSFSPDNWLGESAWAHSLFLHFQGAKELLFPNPEAQLIVLGHLVHFQGCRWFQGGDWWKPKRYLIPWLSSVLWRNLR